MKTMEVITLRSAYPVDAINLAGSMMWNAFKLVVVIVVALMGIRDCRSGCCTGVRVFCRHSASVCKTHSVVHCPDGDENEQDVPALQLSVCSGV